MKINLIIDEKLEDIEIEIKTQKLDERTNKIYEVLKNVYTLERIIGKFEGNKYFINLEEILTIYSNEKKNYLKTIDGKEYQINEKLYELENLLPNKKFIRISNSEIISVKQIERLDYSFNGVIKVITKIGYFSYVSRSYLKNFKNHFNI